MARGGFTMLVMVVVMVVAAAEETEAPDAAGHTDAGVATLPEALPTLPNGCLSPEAHPDCFSASDVTASVVGTFFLTLALVLIGYAVHRLCWRVYNVKLANYAI